MTEISRKYVHTYEWRTSQLIVLLLTLNITSKLSMQIIFEALNIESTMAAFIVLVIIVFLAMEIRITMPTHEAAVERLGKIQRVKDSGITWIMPPVDKSFMVNITKQITEAE